MIAPAHPIGPIDPTTLLIAIIVFSVIGAVFLFLISNSHTEEKSALNNTDTTNADETTS